MEEAMIELCWLPSSFTAEEMTHLDLLLKLGYSKRTIKKWLNHSTANRIINLKDYNRVFSYPLNLINHGKISFVDSAECQQKDKLCILYENSDFAIIFKPHRLHTVPGEYSDGNHVLAHLRAQGYSYLLHLYPQFIDGGFIQRLDYETSGLLVLAKHPTCYEDLRNNYKIRFTQKIYHCWVIGSVKQQTSEISGELIHQLKPVGPKGYLMRATPISEIVLPEHESMAKLQWRWLAEQSTQDGHQWTKLEIVLNTGVRHQIRAQLAQWGFPILGDPLYDPHYRPTPMNSRLYLQHQEVAFHYGQELYQFSVAAENELHL